MLTRAEVRELLEAGTVVVGQRSEVKSQESPEDHHSRFTIHEYAGVEILPPGSRAVRVVHGRWGERVDYLVVPEAVEDAVLAAEGLSLRDLAGIEGVEVAPYLPAGVRVVRSIKA